MNIPKHSCGSDDITFCGSECDNVKCFRHPSNIIHHDIPHSFSLLKDTKLCPHTIKNQIKGEVNNGNGS